MVFFHWVLGSFLRYLDLGIFFVQGGSKPAVIHRGLGAKVKVAFDGLVATFLKAQGFPKKSHEFV